MAQSNTKQSKYAVADFSVFKAQIENKTKQKTAYDKYLLKLELPEGKQAQNSVTVRILPYPHVDSERAYTITGNSFIETFFHHNIGSEKQIACPKFNMHEECAICKHVDSIYKESNRIARKLGLDTSNKDVMRANPEIAELWDMASEMKQSKRVYIPVYVVSVNDKAPTEEQGGVRFFGMSKTLADKLLTKLSIKKRHNPLDLLEGLPIKFMATNNGKTFKGKAFADLDFEILYDEDPSPVLESGDVEEIDKLIDSIPDIWATLLKPSTSEQVAAVMADLLEEAAPQATSAITSGSTTKSNPYEQTEYVPDNFDITEEINSQVADTIGDLDSLLD